MLNEEEQKELKKLSAELREKIEAVFSNPNFNAWRGFRSQLDTILKELIEKPKNIEKEINIADFKGVEDGAKIMEAIASISRVQSETSLKWMKEVHDLVKSERVLWEMLTPQEKELAQEPTLENISKELKNYGKSV